MRKFMYFVAFSVMGWIAVFTANMVYDGRADWAQAILLYGILSAAIAVVLDDAVS